MADFDITKLITPMDIASAATAGIVAYLTFKNADDQQPQAGQEQQPQSQPQPEQPQAPVAQGQEQHYDGFKTNDVSDFDGAAPASSSSPKLNYGFDDSTSPEQMILSNQNFEQAVSNAVDSLNLSNRSAEKLQNALWTIRTQYSPDNEVLHKLLDNPEQLKFLVSRLPEHYQPVESKVFLTNLVRQIKAGTDVVQATRLASRSIGY